MNDINEQILNEVKEYLKSENKISVKKSNFKSSDERISNIDDIIREEIKKWIEVNAEKISKELILKAIKKKET